MGLQGELAFDWRTLFTVQHRFQLIEFTVRQQSEVSQTMRSYAGARAVVVSRA